MTCCDYWESQSTQAAVAKREEAAAREEANWRGEEHIFVVELPAKQQLTRQRHRSSCTQSAAR